jgi:two-component system, cell cycle sensor histidine kinase and response regulator CckA
MSPLWQIILGVLVVIGVLAFALVQRRNRLALASSDLKLRRILQAVESASDAIGIGDIQGTSLYHNRAHIALFGYTVDELNGVPGNGVLFADKSTARAIIEAIFAGRSWTGETDVLTKTGARIPAYVRTDIIRDEQGASVGIFGVFRDITRERQLSEEAARASKLDSLGLMAGSVAHDFNNMLTVILCHVQLAQLDSNSRDAVRECLDEIEAVTLRAQDLTQRLKAFAKGETTSKTLIVLAPLVREAVNLALTHSAVRVQYELPPDLAAVMGDETQIFQIVNNLALNAVQAMPNGGLLTVTAGVVRGSEARSLRLTEIDWVRVSLADTGIGIPAENLTRIFEPFFTTKKEGTGLGLATCYSMVAKHGGHLRVESTPGRGTTFEILLPASDLVPVS